MMPMLSQARVERLDRMSSWHGDPVEIVATCGAGIGRLTVCGPRD
jgi:hypothetical protein